MSKLRDTRKPIEYWNEKDASLERFRSIERSRSIYKMACEKRPDAAPLASLLDRGVRVFLESVSYFYSRGDDLDTIREQSLVPAMQNSLFFQSELSKHPDRIQWKYLTNVGKNPGGAYDVYAFLAYCICLGAEADTMRTLSPVFAKAGEDRLVDLILSRYEPDRVIATGAAEPRIFGDLDKLIDATPEKRIELIKKYLDRWAVLISKLKGMTLLGGLGGLRGAKSNADLETEEFIFPGYKGWWAWEVALMVRVFGIDDSSFADHVLYPVDLARYRHEGADDGLWPMKQASLDDGRIPVDDTPRASGLPGKPRIEDLQLVVVLDLPADAPASSLVDANALIGEDASREERRYLYLAVDERTKVYQEETLVVAAEASPFSFGAYYSSDRHVLKAGHGMIDWVKKVLKTGDGFLPLRKNLQNGDPGGLMELYGVDWQKGLILPIAGGENWAAWLDTIQPDRGGHFCFAVVFRQITPENEILDVRGSFNDRPDLTIGEVMDFWEPLVKKYSGVEW